MTSTKDGYDANDLAGFRQVRFSLYRFHDFVFIFAPRTKTTCRLQAFIWVSEYYKDLITWFDGLVNHHFGIVD